MNRDNIQTTIAILQRAKKFDITSYQRPDNIDDMYDDPEWRFATTEEELHACGNSACIAGYVAVSPEWRALGGVSSNGGPVTDTAFGVAAMMEYWGLNEATVEAIVAGAEFTYFVGCYNLEGMPAQWKNMTRLQAISLFEQLLARDISLVKE